MKHSKRPAAATFRKIVESHGDQQRELFPIGTPGLYETFFCHRRLGWIDLHNAPAKSKDHYLCLHKTRPQRHLQIRRKNCHPFLRTLVALVSGPYRSSIASII
jgi:hypothetical protein